MVVSQDAGLIVNARARSGRLAFARATDQLLARGVKLAEARLVAEPSGLRAAVQQALQAGARLLIVGGGDGTLSTVSTVLARWGATLGVIPLGTANDFARTLGIPGGVDRACAVIAGGQVVDVDLGVLEGVDEQGTEHEAGHFLNVASVSLGAAVAGAVSTRAKGLLGPLAYPVATLKAGASPRPFAARLAVGAKDPAAGPLEFDHVLQLAVGNGRFYGGGRAVSTTAGIDEGALDLYVVGRRGPWELLRVARRLRSGEFAGLGSVASYRTDQVLVKTDPPMAINVDGELRGQRTPVRITVARNALRVLVPAGSSAARLDQEPPR